jgi:hypothetical protein
MVVAVSAAFGSHHAGGRRYPTSTVRRMPRAPRSRLMNSITSRPRSPTRAFTFDIRLDIAGNHAHQGAYSHAAAREDAHACPLPMVIMP